MGTISPTSGTATPLGDASFRFCERIRVSTNPTQVGSKIVSLVEAASIGKRRCLKIEERKRNVGGEALADDLRIIKETSAVYVNEAHIRPFRWSIVNSVNNVVT
jgi:hypothetical protein